jgi:hypothetical protein
MTTPGTIAPFTDDRAPLCIPFILSQLRAHVASEEGAAGRPFFIGLNGVQGVGKTTLVRALADTMRRDAGLETLVCSIDDFYLTREDQVALAQSQKDNPLVQVRGEPGRFFFLSYPVPAGSLRIIHTYPTIPYHTVPYHIIPSVHAQPERSLPSPHTHARRAEEKGERVVASTTSTTTRPLLGQQGPTT